jgi:hypothetical protein
MLGGSDVNRDGVITYAELEGFVDTAAADIPNPRYRPQVFARGPGGRGDAPLLRLGDGAGVRLLVEEPEPARLAIRDTMGLRWIDVHQERAAALVLRLPSRLGEGALVEHLSSSEGGWQVLRRQRVESSKAGAELKLATLASVDTKLEGRGASDLFRGLFARPFGPAALNAHQVAQSLKPTTVYGISREDAERMKLLLGELADSERDMRWFHAGAEMSTALAWLTIGLARAGGAERRVSWPDVTIAALLAADAMNRFGKASLGERMQQAFAREVDSTPDPSALIARTELGLAQLDLEERRTRRVWEVIGFSTAAAGATAIVLAQTLPRPTLAERNNAMGYGFGAVAIGGALALWNHFIPSPGQKIVSLWRQDPRLNEGATPEETAHDEQAALAAFAPPEDERAIRAIRRFGVAQELGWKAMAPIGLNLSFHATPHLTLEAGVGGTTAQTSGGARLRLNLMTTDLTPFVAAGLMFQGHGTFHVYELEPGFDVIYFGDGEPGPEQRVATIQLRTIPLVQAVGGVEWIARPGFTVRGTLGWVEQLADPLLRIDGDVEKARPAMIEFGSGLSFGVALGVTF